MSNRKSPLYTRWKSLKQRCLNPRNPSFINYGARGTTICEEWKNDFRKFEKYCLDLEPDLFKKLNKELQIDRINNNGSYEPGNIRFTSRTVNMRNTRKNHLYLYKDMYLRVGEMVEISGLDHRLISHRLKYGWSVEDVIEIPPLTHKTTLKKYKKSLVARS